MVAVLKEPVAEPFSRVTHAEPRVVNFESAEILFFGTKFVGAVAAKVFATHQETQKVFRDLFTENAGGRTLYVNKSNPEVFQEICQSMINSLDEYNAAVYAVYRHPDAQTDTVSRVNRIKIRVMDDFFRENTPRHIEMKTRQELGIINGGAWLTCGPILGFY